ncbi:MAG TPA: GNAT family N-acetyltransferase [Geomonas sp.]|nr:GNAT family N-acetyltransferase [Geomonas sp.]
MDESVQVTIIRRAQDLEPLRAEWAALAAGAPMRSPEWLLTWWRHYADAADELWVLLFREPAGALVGLAPLFVEVRGRKRTLRLLGCGGVGTTHSSWLAAAGWQERVSLAAAACLRENRASWQSLRLDCVDQDDPALGATLAALAADGFLLHRTPLHSCWKLALPEEWEQYLAMLSKAHRKRCRKLQHDYLDSGRVTLHRVTGVDDFQRGFQILVDLHAARWGGPKEPLGCFSDPRFLAFHQAVARQLLEREQLNLSWLECDGRPIAAEYQFMDQTTVYSYQAGMDPEVTDLPAGNLSIMSSIHFAICQGRRFFDLSTGDQPYKANWRATPSGCHDVQLWPATLAGRLNRFLSALRDCFERARMAMVVRLKAVIPLSLVEAWRQALQLLSGRRRTPRKVGSPR